MTTQIILVRHGETEWNRVERFRGRADLELNENGIRQAKATAQSLSGVDIVAVYSSPLKRASATAGEIARAKGLNVISLEGVVDINYGDWQGLTPEEVAIRDPEGHGTWEKTPHLAEIPGGESLLQVGERAVRALEDVVKAHSGETVVIVSHKVVCKVLLCAVLGLGENLRLFWNIQQDTCAVNRIEWEQGMFRAIQINDTCHLRSLMVNY